MYCAQADRHHVSTVTPMPCARISLPISIAALELPPPELMFRCEMSDRSYELNWLTVSGVIRPQRRSTSPKRARPDSVQAGVFGGDVSPPANEASIQADPARRSSAEARLKYLMITV